MSHNSLLSFQKIAKKLGFHTNSLAVREFLGVWKSRFKGNGISFSESRPWQSGDPKNRIDWKTTAKKNTVYVKEFEEERQLRFMCFADAGYSMHPKKETVINIISLFCYAALDVGDHFGGGVFDTNVSGLLKPSQSLSTIERWKYEYITMLNNSKAGNNSSLFSLIKYLYAMNLKDSICIIVCDDFIEEDLPLLSRLANHNDCIVIHLFNDLEVNLQESEGGKHGIVSKGGGFLGFQISPIIFSDQKIHDYKERFEEKRAQTQHYINKSGADYIMINDPNSIGETLIKFFTQRKNRR